MRSPLARLLPETPTSAEHLEAMRRRAWLDQGVIVLRPDELRDDFARQAIVNEATRRWGRRQQGRR